MNETVYDLLHLADVSLNREMNYSKALDYVEEALRLDQNSVKAHLLKGLCQLRLGILPKAITEFDTVVSLDEDNSEALLNLAYIHIRSTEYDKARELIGRVLARSQNSDAFGLLGDMEQLRGSYREAADYYDKAISLSPTNAKFYFHKAICHYQLKQFKECYKYAEIALEINPTHPEANELAEKAADQQFYGDVGFVARLLTRPMRPFLKRQLKEQIKIHDEMVKINKRTEELSIDPNMKIKNRSYLDLQLPILCDLMREKGKPISLIFLDLDNMKIYNSLYGHPKLDEILRMIGGHFLETVGSGAGEVAARYAGDEFVMVLPQTSKPEAKAAYERFIKKIEELNVNALPGMGINKKEASRITFSAGLASAPEDMEIGADSWPNQLVNKADQAAMRAKVLGKNQLCIYKLDEKEAFKASFDKLAEEARSKALKGQRD